MKPGDYEYDQLVNKLLRERRLHKSTTMTEAETQAEILRIQDGAKSSFESINVEKLNEVMMEASKDLYPIKKRGWPKGKKRGPRK